MQKMTRPRVLAAAAALTAVIAILDWRVEPNVSLGFFYFLPVLLVASFLSRTDVTLLAVVCAFLREVFSPFAWDQDASLRMPMVLAALLGTGLLTAELANNRRVALRHLREMREMEEQLRFLIETSPAAILIASRGEIVHANRAAHRLLGFEAGSLVGRPIAASLPLLERIPEPEIGNQPVGRWMECKGLRGNGEVFLAHVWFSTYSTASGPRLAAIVGDASEQLLDREEVRLHASHTAFRVLAGAVSHEVRNLSATAAVVHANLGRLPGLAGNEDYRSLGVLVEGLEKISSAKPPLVPHDAPGGVNLPAVLDELRIFLELYVRDSGVRLRWELDPSLPPIRGDHHALLQVFLNLAKNSLRALQNSPVRELTFSAVVQGGWVIVRCRDTGCGVAAPEKLFQPFQSTANGGFGLGLYISRSLVRAFGGGLFYEPQPLGSCFAVHLARASNALVRSFQ